MKFIAYKSFILGENLYEFSHAETSNSTIEKMLNESAFSSDRPIIRLLDANEASKMVQVNTIETSKRFLVPLYSSTPAKIQDLHESFKVIVHYTAKYVGPADTGRQGEGVLC